MPAFDALGPYLDQLAVPAPVRARITELLRLYRVIYGFDDNPEYVFLEDVITPEGQRNFTNLACIGFAAYVDFMIPEPNWWSSISPLANIETVQVGEVQNFDFQNATEASRLRLYVRRANAIVLTFNATGQNCMELFHFAQDMLIPRIKRIL